MVDQLQQQFNNMTAAFAQLQQQQQDTEARAAAAEARAAAAEAMPTALANMIAGIPAAMTAATASSSAKSLVDVRGLGKPPIFSNSEEEYMMWSRKVESYVGGVFPACRPVLQFISEQQAPVDLPDIAIAITGTTEAELRSFSEQLHACLMALTTNESFNITIGSGSGEGIEAWRRLSRRWDPLTAGRARTLLRDILAPKRARIDTLQASLEALEEQMRRYTQRRDVSGRTHDLAEDIRMSSLEALLPEDLEKHVQLNRQRLGSYELLREEVVLYAETRTGVARRSHAGGAGAGPMDVDMGSLAKGDWKGRGKGKGGDGTKGKGKGHPGGGGKAPGGKGDQDKNRECFWCGKKGHLVADCWAKANGKPKTAGAGRGSGGGGSGT